MLVLALDSALAGCSAALWQDGAVLAVARDERPRGQAEALLPLVESVLAGRPATAINRIAVTVGPGRFTGLRIGLAAARGLSLATGRPVHGVTVTDALAAAAGPGSPLCVVVDSLRAEDVFAALYDAQGALAEPPRTADPAALVAGLPPGCRLAGDGVARLDLAARPDLIALPFEPVDPAVVAALAAARTGAGDAPDDLRPLYLRPADVTLTATRPAPL